MAQNSTVYLGTGQAMPILGFGTWQSSGEELEAAVDAALEAGYRHIDTAAAYENESIIGNVLKKWLDSGKIKRSDLFIVTKLATYNNRPDDVEKSIKRSLNNLQLSYLDLYLVHVPFTIEYVEDDMLLCNEKGEIRIDVNTDHLKIWSMMERQVHEGRTRAIGLSNFNVAQIKRILNHAKLPISNLQIELHLYLQQKELVKFCWDNNISVTAYSPLGARGLVKKLGKTESIPDMLENPTLLEIAKVYKKTPAQILLKFIIQRGIAVIPKSVTPKRIKENIQLFDWELEYKDVDKLNTLDKGESARICDFIFFKGIEKHPEYPF